MKDMSSVKWWAAVHGNAPTEQAVRSVKTALRWHLALDRWEQAALRRVYEAWCLARATLSLEGEHKALASSHLAAMRSALLAGALRRWHAVHRVTLHRRLQAMRRYHLSSTLGRVLRAWRVVAVRNRCEVERRQLLSAVLHGLWLNARVRRQLPEELSYFELEYGYDPPLDYGFCSRYAPRGVTT